MNEADESADKVNNKDFSSPDPTLHNIDIFADYPDPETLSAAHTVGRVVLDKRMHLDELVKVLCDTGALSANYVAADLVKRLESKLSNKRFFRTKCKVTLADNRTTQNINRGVKLKLVL